MQATSFSETFCEAFPPCRLHHQRTVSNVSYRGLAWTPDQKDVILAELENRQITQHAIATYLRVSDDRINKLAAHARKGGSFHIVTGRPPKVDDIGCAEIQQAVLQRKTQKLPMKESEAYQAISTAAIETNIRRVMSEAVV